MKLALTAAVALLPLLSAPLFAQQQPAVPVPETTAIDVDALRTVLQQHPELVIEAIRTYEANERLARARAINEAVIAHADELYATGSGPYIGADEPAVTLVKFSDYRCPHCMAASEAIKAVLETNPDVRVIIRELPILGEASAVAAAYALAVEALHGQEAYEALHRRAFERKGAVGPEWINEDIASQGFDHAALVAAMDSEEISLKLAANLDLARRMGITGTPFIAVAETGVPGALDAQSLQMLINDNRPATDESAAPAASE